MNARADSRAIEKIDQARREAFRAVADCVRTGYIDDRQADVLLRHIAAAWVTARLNQLIARHA